MKIVIKSLTLKDLKQIEKALIELNKKEYEELRKKITRIIDIKEL